MEQAMFMKVAILVFCVMVFALLMGFSNEFSKLLDKSKEMHKERDAKLSQELETGLAYSSILLKNVNGQM